jgi:uncharacterized protein Yka (UPF0111/DUF47 family)
MLERLFPDERKFFERFTGVAQHLTAAARLLEQAFDAPPRLVELCTRIEQVDRETDAAVHDLDAGADRMFIPPLDRDDIHLLSIGLGRVVDIIGGTARRAVSLRATERHEAAVRLARILVRAVEEIEAAVGHIREGDEVLAHCRRIKQAEKDADGTWEAAVSDLFAGDPDPLEVLRWKTIYDQLEEAVDACDDVANELETITVKHA